MAKKVAIIAGVLLALVLAIPLSNFFVTPPIGTALTVRGPADPLFSKVAAILEVQCLNCHSSESSLPFYASLPIVGGIIEADIEAGRRAMDMLDALLPPEGTPVSEVVLARMEQVINRDSMPPGRYLALHWDGGLDDDDRVRILGWIREVRVLFHAPPGLPEQVRGRAIHPLPESSRADPTRVALGKRLFHDTRLSRDDTLSCASCHALNKGGTDQARFSTGVDGAKGTVNSPTVYNAVFHFRQFWDGRAADLAEQADGPVNNPVEMAANWPEVIAKLQRDDSLTRDFLAAYPDGFSAGTITHAIAAFESTLVTPGSRFDRFLSGDGAALDDQEKRGYQLFLDHDCGTCHVGKALGGQSYELMGRRSDYFADRGSEIEEADRGRFNVTGLEDDMHRFKVPSLRNIALTFPYLHDGSLEDLADVVSIMSRYQVEPTLSKGEIEQVVLFLHTLTGTYKGKLLK